VQRHSGCRECSDINANDTRVVTHACGQ
jgi:hypothetical protein